jgi:hypothetical protein
MVGLLTYPGSRVSFINVLKCIYKIWHSADTLREVRIHAYVLIDTSMHACMKLPAVNSKTTLTGTETAACDNQNKHSTGIFVGHKVLTLPTSQNVEVLDAV